MNPNYKNLRVVPQLIYGRGSVGQLGDVLAPRRTDSATPTVFLIDDVFEEAPFVRALPVHANDLIIFVNVFVPTKLSKDEKETLEKLAVSETFKPTNADNSGKSSFFDRMRDFFQHE